MLYHSPSIKYLYNNIKSISLLLYHNIIFKYICTIYFYFYFLWTQFPQSKINTDYWTWKYIFHKKKSERKGKKRKRKFMISSKKKKQRKWNGKYMYYLVQISSAPNYSIFVTNRPIHEWYIHNIQYIWKDRLSVMI